LPCQPRWAAVRSDGEAAPAEIPIEAVAKRLPALEQPVPVAPVDAPGFANLASVLVEPALSPPRVAHLAPLVAQRSLAASILPVEPPFGPLILGSASTPLRPIFVAAPAALRTSLAAAPASALGAALATAFLIGLDVLALALAAAAAPILFECQHRHRHRQSAYAREQQQLTHDPFLP
jgi:hypothetical protein